MTEELYNYKDLACAAVAQAIEDLHDAVNSYRCYYGLPGLDKKLTSIRKEGRECVQFIRNSPISQLILMDTEDTLKLIACKFELSDSEKEVFGF